MNQRWRFGREFYRPKGEVIKTSEYDVVPMPGKDERAIAFVKTHHYSGTYPSGKVAFGLYRRGELSGIACFSIPQHPAVLENVFGDAAKESIELGRFVLLDEVPGNGETWFLAQCFRHLRKEGFAGVLAFSDPMPRQDAKGRIVHRGHIGTIYQAANGVYLGRGRARVKRLFPDGTVAEERTLSKIPTRQDGWRPAVDKLVAYGAEPFRGGDLGAWLKRELARITRPFRHAGNHKYAWSLDPAVRLPASLPFPKVLDNF